MDKITLLVISNPAGKHLKRLNELKQPVEIHVGNDPEFLAKHAPDADVILVGGVRPDLLHGAFPLAQRVRWVHVLWAGVEKILSPELIASPVPLTNGRGVFRNSLAEFALASILYFAKDFRRLVRNQEAGRWEQFDVTEVRGQVFGVVGYGEIGRAAASLAHAIGMRVHAVRRRAGGSSSEPIVERLYSPSELHEMLPECDYVLVATPLTDETRGMIGEAEFAVMKPSAVIINVGRGPVIVESALIEALEHDKIKGAALDVFDTEPLPTRHSFYRLSNVLLSPHSADHTVGWINLAMDLFIANFELFRNGQPLKNIVDKHAGY